MLEANTQGDSTREGLRRPQRSAWLELLRVPNLLSVPGDPLAGALLAAAAVTAPVPWPGVVSCLLASLMLYAGGLLSNDYFDREEDGRERPARPIPSGRVKAGKVLASAVLFTLAALAFAAEASRPSLAVAALLAGCIWIYNLGAKRCPVLGPLTMGACRGLSLLLGAAAFGRGGLGAATPWIAAALLAVYIGGVTIIARRETEAVRRPGWQLAFPVVAVFAGLAVMAFLQGGPSFAVTLHRPGGFMLGLSAMAVVWVALWCGQLAGTPSPAAVQRGVGSLIRGLILVQAALCAVGGPSGELASLFVLAAFPVASWLGTWFYGS